MIDFDGKGDLCIFQSHFTLQVGIRKGIDQIKFILVNHGQAIRVYVKLESCIFIGLEIVQIGFNVFVKGIDRRFRSSNQL